jgi:hypothetical protein
VLQSEMLTIGIARDLPQLLNTSHHSPNKYTLETPTDIIFSGNNSCILSPEVTEGPYCKSIPVGRIPSGHTDIEPDVAGEYVRDKIDDGQAGVRLALDLQVLDIETCDPVENAYLEIWRKFWLLSGAFLRDASSQGNRLQHDWRLLRCQCARQR